MYVEFAPLSEYLKIAKKFIKKFAPKIYRGLDIEMLKSDDAIGDVAYAIMKADQKWNPSYRSKTNKVCGLNSFRTKYARWQIYRYVSHKNRLPQTISLSYKNTQNDFYAFSGAIEDHRQLPSVQMIDNLDLINNIMSSGVLTDKQVKYIQSYYLDNKTYKEIGLENGVSKQDVQYVIQYGIKSLRERCII